MQTKPSYEELEQRIGDLEQRCLQHRFTEEILERLEGQLRRAQKMEAIATLAGGIAHDFNNILGAIIGNAELIEIFGAPLDAAMRSRLGEILLAARRARSLVEQILTVSKSAEHKKCPTLLSPVVKETLRFLRSSLPSTIDLRERIENEHLSILADATQIHQVLMNLCTNAGHAMRERGGILEIELSQLRVDATAVRSLGGLGPGAYARLVVSDTGHGIERDVIEKIFDPYFTTKKKDEGTGLGLAVARGIVKGHGGAIMVESKPGRGSVFQVLLPMLEDSKVDAAIETETALPTGKERILFVDDEKSLVKSTRGILERLGYTVVATTSSIEALETFRQHPDRFDLVITDLTMPGMTGVELSKGLLSIRPDIPIVLCTGFLDTVIDQEVGEAGICECLSKPVDTRSLAEAVRKVLDR